MTSSNLEIRVGMKDFSRTGGLRLNRGLFDCSEEGGGDSWLWYEIFVKKTQILKCFPLFFVLFWIFYSLFIDFMIATLLKNGFHQSCFSIILLIDFRKVEDLKTKLSQKDFWRDLLILLNSVKFMNEKKRSLCYNLIWMFVERCLVQYIDKNNLPAWWRKLSIPWSSSFGIHPAQGYHVNYLKYDTIRSLR